MECPQVPSTSYLQFGERLYAQALAKRLPLNGSMELTFRCNLRCVHCYCNRPPNDPQAMEQELGTDEILRIFDQIAEAGCLWLLLSGGEPLLREDFLDLYTHAIKRGFITTVFTNGTLLTPEIGDHLAEWPPHAVEITLYGVTQRTYERVTGIPGSFERCQRGIQLLTERKIPLGLKTMAMTLNRGELFQIKEYAERLGAKFRFDPLINPRLDGSKRPCRFRLAPEEVIRLDLADEKRVEEWREFCRKFVGPQDSHQLFNCGAGISNFHVDCYGKLSACEMIRFQSYDLRSGSFDEGWSERIPRFLELKPTGDYPCGPCELLSLCGQCPGWAWLEHADPETPVNYLCQIAHLRAEAFQENT